MKTAAEWLDAIKRKHKVTSDWAVSKLLETDHAAISHYRAGRRAFDPYMAVKVAALLDLDPLKVIASAEAERARTDDKKEFWKRLAACVLIAAGAGSVSLTPPPAQAAGSLHNSGSASEVSPNTHCALKPRRRRFQAASAIAAMAQVLLPISRNRLA